MVNNEGTLTKLWDNHWVREIVLFLVSVIAVQFAFSANSLLDIVNTSEDFGDVWAGGSTWGASFIFAAFQTGIKQAVAGLLAWAANRTLAGPQST
jgi:hypothetical protein